VEAGRRRGKEAAADLRPRGEADGGSTGAGGGGTEGIGRGSEIGFLVGRRQFIEGGELGCGGLVGNGPPRPMVWLSTKIFF
jgi:hypothetical protein